MKNEQLTRFFVALKIPGEYVFNNFFHSLQLPLQDVSVRSSPVKPLYALNGKYCASWLFIACLNDGVKSVGPTFWEVILGTINLEVHAASHVPITELRSLSISGVRRMRFIRGGWKQRGVLEDTIYCDLDWVLTVSLFGTLEYYVYDHFQNLGLSMNDAKEKKYSHSELLGFFDGTEACSHIGIDEVRLFVKKILGELSQVCYSS